MKFYENVGSPLVTTIPCKGGMSAKSILALCSNSPLLMTASNSCQNFSNRSKCPSYGPTLRMSALTEVR